MRRAFQPQLQIGQMPIDQVEIDLDSRDDIPSILHGLKRLYMEEPVFGEVMELLESNVLAGRDHGRAGRGWNFGRFGAGRAEAGIELRFRPSQGVG